MIDQTRCIGCHACTTACKSENEIPVGVTRTYVKSIDIGVFPQVRRAFQVTRCNQCADAPCVTACPTAAMFRRPDGIVDFAKSICIGCKACIAACPYDAIFINPEDHSAEKCNMCAHRIDMGLEPACVIVCPTEAILVGDVNDPLSRVAQIVQREPVVVRRPEKGSKPQLFYKGAHQATLDPLAARRPRGQLFMWSEQKAGAEFVVSGHPGLANSSAAALLSYDVPHSVPWNWKVSLYTWTKGIAAGTYLVLFMLIALGVSLPDSVLWQWAMPVVSGGFLAATGVLLISDLEHPARFFLIFTRPQWKSWLVKGAFIILGYSIVLAIHTFASVFGPGAQQWLAILGVPFAILTAVYTAYLFAQAKARDLWQNPLLPFYFLVQAVLAGAAAVAPVAAWMEPAAVPPLLIVVGSTSLVHLLLAASEVALPHVTAHARLASHEMVRGRYRHCFQMAVAALAVGALAPWIGWAAAVVALAGLAAYEHAHVQAGQAVPLA